MHARALRRRGLLGAVAAAAVCSLLAPAARAQRQDTIPAQVYFVGIEQLYQGDYRDALRTFDRAWRGAVKTLGANGQIRWIDSICYHAMLGETYYHMGQNDAALKQFDSACELYLQNPRWMLRVQFDAQPTVSNTLTRNVAPWGASRRQAAPGSFPETFGVAQGSIDNSSVVQNGGVLQQAQLWSVNVVEIARCTALAIRRRNEIVGPLGPHDTISKNLALVLGRGGAPPNHWSSAWVDVQRGFALAGVGEIEQALAALDSGTLVAGRLDHPLTGMALLEQGRLALDAGNIDAAAVLLAEASYSGFMYGDAGVIDEAFRWGGLNHLASGGQGVNEALAPAAAWARRERYGPVAARINFILAEQLLAAGDDANAATALAAGVSLLGDARNGRLGNAALFLEAKLEFARGRAAGGAKLATAIQGQAGMSVQNFQIARANAMFDAQSLPTRTATSVYELLLADPTPADAVLRLLESMAVMTTPHEDGFDRWLIAALDRGNLGAAIEVTDRAKRRRFHNVMPWGGRLAALRDLLAAPAGTLDARRQQQRDDLLARFTGFASAANDANALRTQLQQLWLPVLDDDGRRKTAALWKSYTTAMQEREARLGQVGLTSVAADVSFPPLLTAAELQSRLVPGQALLVYHDTPGGLMGFLFTSKSSTTWNCGPSVRVGNLVSTLLQDMGNYDANREMTTEALMADDWHTASEKLAGTLLEGSSMTPSSVTELIVVPDGVTWYAPFEALVVSVNGQKTPLVKLTKIRYAPTVGLAFSNEGAWRRVQRTGLVIGKMVPGEKPEERAEAAAALTAAIPSPYPLAMPSETASPVVASLLDALVVLDDVDAGGSNPFAWSPLPIDRAAQVGSLDQWLALPGDGPQRILLPGMHTLAERGGKPPRRREAAPAGADLFYASCSLMSAGAETMLLSRWRVGGLSTLDLVREFVQELPHTSAAEAWQRSVQLSMETPVDAASELRVKPGKNAAELTGKHPFFWAGYLVVDSGWRPEQDAESDAPPAEPTLVLPGATAPGAAMPGGLPAEAPAEGAAPEGVPPVQTPPVPKPPAPTPPAATPPAAAK